HPYSRMVADGSDTVTHMDTQGKPFSAVFCRLAGAERHTWRVRNSGVQFVPRRSKETRAVLEACSALGIPLEEKSSGSPANADSYTVRATFLDGGIEGQTGNYWYAPRGVWIRGTKAVLLLALQLGLSVRRGWYIEHGLTGATLHSLRRELATPGQGAQELVAA